jgi:hypothetical protein
MRRCRVVFAKISQISAFRPRARYAGQTSNMFFVAE